MSLLTDTENEGATTEEGMNVQNKSLIIWKLEYWAHTIRNSVQYAILNLLIHGIKNGERTTS